jgi:hypothetical protein
MYIYRCMENLRVIQVKVVAPEKPLDINTFPKNNPDVDFTIYVCLKISLCGYGQLRYPKILYVDLGLSAQTKITVLDIKPMPYSFASSVLSLSPNLQYLILSLCLTPPYVSPVLIPHKKRMMFHNDYHCLIDNKCLRTHLLFHLSFDVGVTFEMTRTG